MPKGLLFAVLLIAGCAQLSPTPQDIQAKRFETAPDKAAIYIVRGSPDFNSVQALIVLDDAVMITTYAGTYYRWEVAPGRHRIAGLASDSGVTTLDTTPGRIYFVRQRLSPSSRSPMSMFSVVGEQEGRDVALQGQLVSSR